MKNRDKGLILYFNKEHLTYHRAPESLFDKLRLPYQMCCDVNIQLSKGITRIPMIELPSGEIITYKEFLVRLDEIKAFYGIE